MPPNIKSTVVRFSHEKGKGGQNGVKWFYEGQNESNRHFKYFFALQISISTKGLRKPALTWKQEKVLLVCLVLKDVVNTRYIIPPRAFCCSSIQLTTGMDSSNFESSLLSMESRANPVISMLTEFGTAVHGLPFSKSSRCICHHFLPSLICAIESNSLKAWMSQDK